MKKYFQLIVFLMISTISTDSYAIRDLVSNLMGSSAATKGPSCPISYDEDYIRQSTQEINQTLERGSMRQKKELFQSLAMVDQACNFLTVSTRNIRFSTGSRQPAQQAPSSSQQSLSARRISSKNSDFRPAQMNENNCSTTPLADNDSEPTLEQTLGPIRNQGAASNCYAHAAADLLTHRLRQENPDHSVEDLTLSAIDIARAHNLELRPHELLASTHETEQDGGFIYMAIAAASQRGLCPESALPSNDHAISELKELERSLDNMQARTRQPRGHDGCHDCLAGFGPNDWPVGDRVFYENLEDVVNVLTVSTRGNLVDNLIEEKCDGRRINFENSTTKEHVRHHSRGHRQNDG